MVPGLMAAALFPLQEVLFGSVDRGETLRFCSYGLILDELLLVAVTHFYRASESAHKPQQPLSLSLSPRWPGSYIQYMLDSLILFSTVIAGSTLRGFALTGTLENHLVENQFKEGGAV